MTNLSSAWRRAAGIGVASLAVIAVVGCSGEGTAADAGSENLGPAEAPTEWESHTLEGVEFSTPSSWDVYDEMTLEEHGVAGVGYGTPEDVEPLSLVYVMSDPDPDRDVTEELDHAWEVTWRTRTGAEKQAQEVFDWPGAEGAGYQRYVADDTDYDGDYLARNEMLLLDLESGEQITVIVSAPDSDYDESVAHQVLASVRVTGS